MACFRVCRKLISLTLTRLSIFLVARNNAVKVELTLATIPDLSKLVTSAYVVVEIILANVHRRIYKRAMTGFTPQSRCGHQRKDVITRGFNLGRRLDQPWVYVNWKKLRFTVHNIDGVIYNIWCCLNARNLWLVYSDALNGYPVHTSNYNTYFKSYFQG